MNNAKLSASVMNEPSDLQSRCQKETSLDGSETKGLQKNKANIFVSVVVSSKVFQRIDNI